MIGFYDYTVILTYLSLLSSSIGIVVSLTGERHPIIGSLLLLFCGFCDMFDGKIASNKKNRTEDEKNFGIQIDSLSDLVAFGILPVCIGAAILWDSSLLSKLISKEVPLFSRNFFRFLFFGILVLYSLCALIRLAYFNILTLKKNSSNNSKQTYVGVPVTVSALIFPLIILLQDFLDTDLTILYFSISLILSFLFISEIKITKPTLKELFFICILGALEFLILFLVNIYC